MKTGNSRIFLNGDKGGMVKMQEVLQECSRMMEDGELNVHINELVMITDEEAPYFISVGKFNGRGEAIYQRRGGDTGIFIYVMRGAFEAEGRLLHEQDGLAIWDVDKIEMEALSNGALVCLVECRLA
jgi:hypothetical protein